MDETLYSNEELEGALGWEIRYYFPPVLIEHGAIRVSHIFEGLAMAIQAGDELAIELGCRLIKADPRLPFGRSIKGRIARAQKKYVNLISSKNRQAIILKTSQLLELAFAPRELKHYCKLIKQFDAGEWHDLVAGVKPRNRKAKWLVSGLLSETR